MYIIHVGLHQVRWGSHPAGPSGHECWSDVLSSLSDSNQLLKSNSVSSVGNSIQRQASSFQIIFYIVHPPLLRASNRSFSFQLWTVDGQLSLFILEIGPYHFIFLFQTIFSAISCPVLTRTSALLTLSVYLMRSIRRNHRFSHAFSLFSKAVVKLQVSLPCSRFGITAALSSLSFIAL